MDPAGKKLPSTIVKKILLLRAIVNEPDILFLEDPWLGFHENVKNSFVKYLHKIRANTTVLIVSSNSDFVSECDFKIHLENETGSLIKI